MRWSCCLTTIDLYQENTKMFGSWGPSPRSTIWAAAAAVAPLLLLSHIAPRAAALYVTEGSPCWDVCNDPTNTTSSEIVCLDAAYNDTTTGEDFQKCISCALESNYTDPNSQLSDVDWGLCECFSTLLSSYCADSVRQPSLCL